MEISRIIIPYITYIVYYKFMYRVTIMQSHEILKFDHSSVIIEWHNKFVH